MARTILIVDDEPTLRETLAETLEEDGLRVITAGLKAEEWIVVGSLQQVRPKLKIKPDRMPMPSLDQPVASEKPAEKPAPASPAKNSQPRK